MEDKLFSSVWSEDDEIGSKMKEVLDVMGRFSFSSFLNSVYHKLKSDDEVRRCTQEVRLCTSKMQMEYDRMDRGKLKFLNSIVTKDNHCYDTCHFLANKLRCSIAGSKRIFRKFHQRAKVADNRKRQLMGIGGQSDYASSLLGIPATSDVFGLGSYPESVTELFEAMKEFNEQLRNIFVLINEVVVRESEIRSDHEQCYDLLLDFLHECKGYFEGMFDSVEGVGSKNILCPGDIEKMRVENPDDGAFASALYHNTSQGGLRLWILREMYKVRESKGLTEVEQYLWGSDVEKVRRIRLAIENFGSLLPENLRIRSGKLPAKYAAMFMYWCGITNVKVESMFVDYFNKMYMKHGKYDVVLYNAINKSKNGIRNMKDDDVYLDFEHRILTFLKAKLSA